MLFLRKHFKDGTVMADGLIRSHSNEIEKYLFGQIFLLCLAGRCTPSGHIEGLYSSVLSLKRVRFD